MRINKAFVFNIQRFSVHDGPGIRTTIFLKGCNLTCRWCHNPESISVLPQMQYFKEKCVECGMCRKVCVQGIYIAAKQRVNSACCNNCGECVFVCMNDALKIAGQEMTTEEVMKIVRKDQLYYENSNGGLTLSGGEPLLKPDFCAELLKKAHGENIGTAVDTAANIPYEVFEKILPYTDAILLDIKMMNEAKHKEYTGVSNRQILENAKRLFQEKVDIYIRVPIIQRVNDTQDDMTGIACFLKGRENIKKIELLPYHSLGEYKSESVGRTTERFEMPSKDHLEKLARYFDGKVCY